MLRCGWWVCTAGIRFAAWPKSQSSKVDLPGIQWQVHSSMPTSDVARSGPQSAVLRSTVFRL